MHAAHCFAIVCVDRTVCLRVDVCILMTFFNVVLVGMGVVGVNSLQNRKPPHNGADLRSQ